MKSSPEEIKRETTEKISSEVLGEAGKIVDSAVEEAVEEGKKSQKELDTSVIEQLEADYGATLSVIAAGFEQEMAKKDKEIKQLEERDKAAAATVVDFLETLYKGDEEIEGALGRFKDEYDMNWNKRRKAGKYGKKAAKKITKS